MSVAPSIPIQCFDAAAAEEPVMQSVQDYWSSLNAGNPPSRNSFEFMDIYKQAPHLLMAERVAPKTFSFIYCGTHVAENFPLDLTGKTFGPDSVEASRIPWFDYKSEALDKPCIRFGRDAFDWPNVDFTSILSGIFPLTDDAGLPRFSLASLVFVRDET